MSAVNYVGNTKSPSELPKAKRPKAPTGLVVPAYNPHKDKAIVTPQWERIANGYDWNCGMESDEYFFWFLASAVIADFLEMTMGGMTYNTEPPYEGVYDDRNAVADAGLKRDDGYWNERLPVKPQDLQSAEDALEAIALAKAPVHSNHVDEVVEDIQHGLEHYDERKDGNGNVPLMDGLYLVRKDTFTYLKHPQTAKTVLVGCTDIRIEKIEWISKRGEIRDYLIRIKEMKPNTPQAASEFAKGVAQISKLVTSKSALQHQYCHPIDGTPISKAEHESFQRATAYTIKQAWKMVAGFEGRYDWKTDTIFDAPVRIQA